VAPGEEPGVLPEAAGAQGLVLTRTSRWCPSRRRVKEKDDGMMLPQLGKTLGVLGHAMDRRFNQDKRLVRQNPSSGKGNVAFPDTRAPTHRRGDSRQSEDNCQGKRRKPRLGLDLPQQPAQQPRQAAPQKEHAPP
jgi:hypothetical protein